MRIRPAWMRLRDKVRRKGHNKWHRWFAWYPVTFTYTADMRPTGMRAELVWLETIRQNRIIMTISSIVFLLLGLLNLQNREKFLR